MKSLLSLRVISKLRVAEHIIAIDLVSEDGEDLPVYEPGSHIDLHLAPGLSRCYSLYGRNSERNVYRIAVLREHEGRGGSRHIHDQLSLGDVISATPPRNNFPLHTAPHHVMFAGGIGITPVLSMAWSLWERRESFHLHYCGRSLDRMAFRGELTTAPFASNVSLYTNDAAPSEQLDINGVFSDTPPGTHFYTCGPTGFIDWVEKNGALYNLDSAHFHHEHFAAEIDTKGDEFEVFLARSKLTVNVHENETIASALLRIGLEIPISCAQGVCGNCITTVLEGIPDHRDQYLMDSEKKSNSLMTLCCSRAVSKRLTLDI